MSENNRNRVTGNMWKLRWVKVGDMRTDPEAQRKFRPWRRDKILADGFDMNKFNYPHVNLRPDNRFYIMNGQHGIAAYKQWKLDKHEDWTNTRLECQVSTGLTQAEEAQFFLVFNSDLPPDLFSKFLIAITAGHELETQIWNTAKRANLTITREKVDGRLQCVKSLLNVSAEHDQETLYRSLFITAETYGDTGLKAPIIEGLGAVCGRYNGAIKNEEVIDILKRARGGMTGVLEAAELLRTTLPISKAQAVAATVVKIINRSRKPRNKIPKWWRADNSEK